MRKLCLGLSFASMMLLAACGGDSGSSANDLGESSSSGEIDVIGSCASDESLSSSSQTVDSSTSEESSSSEQDVLSSSNSDDSSSSESVESFSSGKDESSSSKKTSSSNDGVSSSEAESSSSISLSSSDGSIYDVTANTLTDLRDGQVYRTTSIYIPSKSYSEVWMAENLNYRYLGPTADEDSSSFCYDNDPANCIKYGRLYLWSAAMDSAGIIKGNIANGCGTGSECSSSGFIRGICPQGWHLPSKAEWEALIFAVGGTTTEYDDESTAGVKLKSASGWNSSGNGTDDFGFSALPAGMLVSGEHYYFVDGNLYFGDFTEYSSDNAYFWSSTEKDSDNAYRLYLGYDYNGVDLSRDDELFGFSVRCLKD